MQPQYLWAAPALAALIGYLLGSVPFGVILTRLGGAGDLRQIGSGNIGATNVLRTGRKGLAATTLVLDALKGTVAILIAARLFSGHEVVAAGAAFIGHLYPVWLRFRGGKGVATLMGICLGLSGPIALIYAVVWLGLLALIRISSVAGMLAAVSAPISAIMLGRLDLIPLLIGLSALVLWKHRENIDRLLKGAEPRIGGGRGAAKSG